jgi:hypothetical protein
MTFAAKFIGFARVWPSAGKIGPKIGSERLAADGHLLDSAQRKL